ncbi:MAG: NADPH:quinone reductase [Alphaproteobacteria bacterium]|nr:NADPH:quinone reductase [Alphaproteobacteria bacterium]
MQAAWWERNGPAREVLELGEMPTPQPAPGEVLVRVMASGVNPSDVKSRIGRAPAFPRIIPHSDGAGVIAAVGPGVDPVRAGERVWLWNGQWQRAHGTAAEFIALPAAQAVPLPANTSFEAGACLGIPALTALHGLLTDGGIAGQAVLVQGGAGAVGHYAIQFARLLGARRIIATVSSAAKAEHARAAGADLALNYREDDVAARIRAVEPAGVERIIEVDVAGNAALDAAVLAHGGMIAVYGSNKPVAELAFMPNIARGIGWRFYIVYNLTAAERARSVATLNAWMEAGLMRHAVAETLPLSRIADAHEAVEQGRLIGNLVLRIGDA